MDFAWSAEEETFRGEIRDFLQAELPAGWGITQFWDPDDDAQFAFAHEFTKKLGRQNWLAQMERAGVTLDPGLQTALRELERSIDAPPSDPLWEDASLDTHPTWIEARRTARQLLARLPAGDEGVEFGDEP